MSRGHIILFSSAGMAPVPTGPTGSGITVDVQEFTASGTWTKPANAKRVTFYLWSAGSGGGGGPRGDAASYPQYTGGTQGGGGAAGGCFVSAEVFAEALPDTLPVLVGLGGTGGAGASVAGNGSDGTAGGDTTFGGFGAYNLYDTYTAPYGFGSGGSGYQGPAGADYPFNYMDGGRGHTYGPTAYDGDPGLFSPGNGGGGGGMNYYNNPQTPAYGGRGGIGNSLYYSHFYPWDTSAAWTENLGGAPGSNGMDGASGGYFPLLRGDGGGGGGASPAFGVAAGNGGNGGWPGGGGGGGGFGWNAPGGNGGNGADGYARIVTLCWEDA